MDLPFPLDRIGDCIDNVLFVYAPDSLAVHNFNAIVSGFGYEVSYEIPSPLNPASVFYPVFCPVSGKQLATVLLAHYASPHMRISRESGFVTHMSLARLQMEADLLTHKLGQMKSGESPLFPGGANSKKMAMGSSNFPSYFTSSGFFNALPLVHLTVGPGCVNLSGDWISHALHGSVPMLVDNLNWLYNSDLEEKLMRAICQYKRFWVVISRSSPELAVPTLDIRMVWSAHMSNFRQYADFSITKTKLVVVPAGVGVQSTTGLYRTAKKFSELFGCTHCQCQCNGTGGRKFTSQVTFSTSQGHSFSCARNIYELLLPAIVEGEELV